MTAYQLLGLAIRPFMMVGFFAYNKIFTIPRARVILIDDQRRIFLAKHWGSYRQWALPGGGVNRGESPENAAVRELSEELGVDLKAGDLQHLITIKRDHTSIIYVAKAQPDDLPPQPYNRREIISTGWFEPKQMPAHLSKATRAALEYLSKSS